jgi:hypothetical protein
MIDADPHFLGNCVRVQIDKGFEQVFRFLPVVAGVILDFFQQPPVGRVGAVIRQHIEDEPFLDRLAHTVEMERLELPVGGMGAEVFEVRLGVAVKAKVERLTPRFSISARIAFSAPLWACRFLSSSAFPTNWKRAPI